MSPQSGALLLEEIAPRLRATIPKSVLKVGAEDDEELMQEAITMAGGCSCPPTTSSTTSPSCVTRQFAS